MKCTEREVLKLVEELDQEKSGLVNYNEFLKYSYLSQMFVYHFKLELLLREVDQKENTQEGAASKGLVTVKQLDDILKGDFFNFPPGAVDHVLIEMLGVTDVQNIDRNCFIKIDTFMESLRAQFSI